jgi:lipid-binding SYLF domain-containing protein
MMRFKTTLMAGAMLAASSILAACSTAPPTQADRQALLESADSRIRLYGALDPSMDQFFQNSHGYAVFPSVGSGAFIVGGGFGRGVVYEQGLAVGYADITQASIGLQAGGQGFSQVIFFQTKSVLDRFRANNFSFSADASAVAVDSGAAAQTTFKNGVAVFIRSQSGAMASAAVGGQRFRFVPL